ncbi:DUF6087 family protein [Streptomyces melanogenes]|uniref:DUF6087 family protein n=1 Tax=Streptomyces melanogenes TaxID=67326 RepID=UPI00379177FA
MDDEEPLAQWARRRAERRDRAKGRLRAVPLTPGPHRGAHVDPGAPRAIQEFDGAEWVTVGVAENLAAARALLYPPQSVKERPTSWDLPVRVRGRHRRTTAPEEPER